MIVMLGLLSSCNRGDWDMDPRLANLAEWAYECAMDATGLDPDELPVPPVLGVDEPWGDGAWGSYNWPSRRIRVQITRPEAHVANILLHEMGHDADFRLNGGSGGEAYANDINNQCRERNRPDIYPAPPIDW